MDDFRPVERTESELLRFLRALREHWKLIVAIAVTAVVVSAGYSLTTAKRYESTADLLVNPVSPSDGTYVGLDVLRESSDQSRAVLTVARLITSPQLAQTVRTDLHSSLSSRELLSRISVNPLGQSQIVTVTATSGSAGEAARIANGFARAIVQTRSAAFQADVRSQIVRLRADLRSTPAGLSSAIQQRLVELQALLGTPDPTIQVSSDAVRPISPSWPRPKLTVIVALVAALLLGTAIALGLEFFNPRLRREEELRLDHRLPVLTRVPKLPAKVVHGYLSGREPLPGAVWESYRRLRASLTAAGPDGGFPGSILVTSASPGDGKTMTSVNLALTLVSAELKVVLIDGDLRHPMIASIFGIAPRRHGLGGVLLGLAPPEEVLIPVPEHPNLRLLLSRPENAEFVDLLNPRRVASLLAQLRYDADVVIIDSPPVGEAADALAFATAVDTVLVAARLGATQRARLDDLSQLFAQRHVTAAGVVLTTDRKQAPSHYYYTDNMVAPRPRVAGGGAQAAETAKRAATPPARAQQR